MLYYTLPVCTEVAVVPPTSIQIQKYTQLEIWVSPDPVRRIFQAHDAQGVPALEHHGALVHLVIGTRACRARRLGTDILQWQFTESKESKVIRYLQHSLCALRQTTYRTREVPTKHTTTLQHKHKIHQPTEDTCTCISCDQQPMTRE